MKKIFVLLLSLLLLLAACGPKDGALKNEGDELRIGIVQLIEHPALDDAREGFIARLKELGINAKVDYQNAQGDIPTARTISEKFVSDKVDLIYAIATPAAQAAKATTDDLPILFSAVTNAVEADLVETNEKPGSNVTGTSDAANLDEEFKALKAMDASIKKIGVIYSADEVNSITQVRDLEEKAKEYSFEIVAKSINQISDLPQIAQAVINEVDAFYVVTDNKISASISILADLLKENKKISISADQAHVEKGILMAKSLSYKSLGMQTADMAKMILVDKIAAGDIGVEGSKDLELVINTATLNILGLDEEAEILKDARLVK
ncbi:MAG: ABC transporter substrate-binding protein [Tissierellia bacterium]|nr:ABC transporter substrate-binding protein [Tissierellia bacterium]